MNIDLYCSAKNPSKYLAVPTGTNIRTFLFPPNLDPDLRTVGRLKTNLTIIPGRSYIGINAANVVKQIQSQGFANIIVKMTFTVSVGKTP
jgi:hypothetical protein